LQPDRLVLRRHVWIASAVLATGLVLFVSATLYAEITPLSPASWVDGDVKDEWGSPIQDACVVVKHRETGTTFLDYTNEFGEYLVDVGSLTGWFDVTVTKSGWLSKSDSVFKHEAEEAILDFELVPYFYREWTSPQHNSRESETTRPYCWPIGACKADARYNAQNNQEDWIECQVTAYATAITSQYVEFTYNGPATRHFHIEVTAYASGEWEVKSTDNRVARISMKVEGLIERSQSGVVGCRLPNLCHYREVAFGMEQGSFGPLQSTGVISNVYIGNGENCKIYLRTTAHGDIDRTCVPAERYSMANFGDLYNGNHYVQFKKVVVKTAYQ